MRLEADVVVVGAGGAGIMAAIEAARSGAESVLLLERSMIGRGGATVMAQMTVAAATEPDDDWRDHLSDTLAAGRGLCDPRLAALLCEDGPARIREMDAWRTGWARDGAGFRRVQAPGHGRARCVYVDVLNTGPAVSRALRGRVQKEARVRRVSDFTVTEIVVAEGRARGVVGYDVASGEAHAIAAGAVVLATGGLTRLYARNSASANMSGDGHALALRAGAALIDMEFVQFFPIGHLAPRLVGMDPIMWDPFRYKLGGRLLNGAGEEFLHRYGEADEGRYTATRDRATHAILSEVAAGRGTPHGGAFLSFRHVPAAELRAAFGPVIDKLAANGIDLTRDMVEVAPIAHYHMGGIQVEPDMATAVPGLLAAGEVVGGANGANRLSGNAITEALVFGHVAGRSAARLAAGVPRRWDDAWAADALALAAAEGPARNAAAIVAALQATMHRLVGPFRTDAGLRAALASIAALRDDAGTLPPGRPGPHDLNRLDWFDLRAMLLTAEAVTQAALARTESRGAHQRDDFPHTDPGWTLNQMQRLDASGTLTLAREAVPA